MAVELVKIQEMITEQFAKTNAKIDSFSAKVNEVYKAIAEHTDRLNQLEKYTATDNRRIDYAVSEMENLKFQLELQKQDSLRNNLRITGLPTELVTNATNTMAEIITNLNVALLPTDFIAYSDKKQVSIIARFDHNAHKRLIMEAFRKREKILVEEVFQTTRSNAQICCNDQLSPYFASLFKAAWNAKKNKLIHSASSVGGRIRIRMTENSRIVLIQNENQLNALINELTSTETINNEPSGSTSSAPQQQLETTESSNKADTKRASNEEVTYTRQENTAFPKSHQNRQANLTDHWKPNRNQASTRQHHQRNRYQHHDKRRHNGSPQEHSQRNYQHSKSKRLSSPSPDRYRYRNYKSN